MNDVVDILLTVEDKLRSKGILILRYNGSLISEIRTGTRKYDHCKGISGYIIVDYGPDLMCVECINNNADSNPSIMDAVSSIIEEPLTSMGYDLEYRENGWEVKIRRSYL